MELTKKEAIKFLEIPEKDFENYHKKSEEIIGYKKRNRWYFDKNELIKWNDIRIHNTITLSLEQYEECFEFAIKMAYSGLTKFGIRGTRSEVQLADDVILGIMVEVALKDFLKLNFNYEVVLDMDVHTDNITPQDIVGIVESGRERQPNLDIGVKGSKFKNCFLVLGENEYTRDDRKSDIYVFGRVGLPSDHLFRILRDHSFFNKVSKTLEVWKKKYPDDKKRNTIDELTSVDVWICGYCEHKEFVKTKHIPGQVFDGNRYVKNIRDLHNSDKDWKRLVRRL
ncbi:MAG: hypothetical protein HN982_00150 [Candidatus Marinimicrobia bacterium]|jgi:hypothetical protein|nr:hypothetical protein [Candidatus Neomarinimicrobiota bacterium]MBT7269563.1 hypothetical protein [Candidatus Neomarinimicrobiota bacterium]